MKKCRLPLTAAGQVNMIITEMGVMEITPKGIVLTEINPEFTVEQVQAATEATLIISDNLKQIKLDFTPQDLNNAYCAGPAGKQLCPGGPSSGRNITDVDQAVFLCMEDAPNSSLRLDCACAGTCQSKKESNFIAHCDVPCSSGG